MAIKINNLNSQKDSGYTYMDLHLDLQTEQRDGGKGPAASNIVSGNDIVVSKDTSALRNSLINIMTTKKGERPLLPTFGIDLYRYIGEPIVPNTAESIAREIQQGINRWEPRVTIKNIFVIPNPDQLIYNILLILIPKLLTDEQLLLGGNLAQEKGFVFSQENVDDVYKRIQELKQ